MIWTLVIVFVIITVFIISPIIIKGLLNTALGKMDGYIGHIDQLNIQLFKSKISFRNITIRAVADAEQDIPFLQFPVVIIFFKWRPLLKRIIDFNIIVNKPQLYFLSDEPTSTQDENSSIAQEFSRLQNSIKKLKSFKVNVEVLEGEIHYIKAHVKPEWNVTISKLNLKILDFSNRSVLSESCRIASTFNLYEGTGEISVTLRPLEPNLTLDLDMELKSINLVLLNDLFRMYVKIDINKGFMDLFAEVVVAENSFKGYLKPLIQDLDFISKADRSDTIFQKAWERIVAGLFNILANKRNNKIATVIPIEGRLDDPNVHVGVAIIGVLRNAFTKALTPTLENIIDIKSVWHRARTASKSIIQRIFTMFKS